MDNRNFDGRPEGVSRGDMSDKATESIPKVSKHSDVVGLPPMQSEPDSITAELQQAKTAYFSKPRQDEPKLTVERSKLGASQRPAAEAAPRQNPSPQRRAAAEVQPSAQNSAAAKPMAQNPTAAKPKAAGPAAANDATKNIDSDSIKTEQKKQDREKKVRKSRQKTERSESGNTVISLLKCMAYITVVFVVSIIISVAVIFIANDMYGFVKSDEQIEITIPQNATVEEVAEILYNNKIIKYKWLFNMKEGDFSGSFVPGTHTVTPKSSYDDLIELLREKPPSGISWITIPEGYTTDEIINLMVESGIGKKENYVDVINNYDFDYWFVDEIPEDWKEQGRIYRLDGYLFPDTYQFYNASSEEAVISKLLQRFNQVFIKDYKERSAELGYTVDEILMIASLIEKEAGTAADFGNVSSVFHNRLNNPAEYPYLESDATIAYAMQHETGVRPNLTGSDIDNYESPYNSYKVAGLMPGPIANPSNSAILAALNPSETGYYFFVSSDTETFFSTNRYDHEAKVEQIKQEREQNAANNNE